MVTDASALRDVALFKLLDDEDREALAQVIDAHPLEAGQILFHAGDPGDSLYVVRSGRIELFIKDTTGQKIVLSVAESGDLFGELALLDTGPRTATALALEPSELLELDRGDLFLVFQRQPEAALSMLAAVAAMTRKAGELLRSRISRNVNDEFDEQLTTLQRISDWIALFSGSMSFLAVNTIWFIIWIAINIFPLGIKQFDPYPFGLLTMIVSLEAIFLSCFVLISQNRQSEKDHVRSDIEYEINVKAELEVAHLHEKTDRIYEQMTARLERIEKRLPPASH